MEEKLLEDILQTIKIIKNNKNFKLTHIKGLCLCVEFVDLGEEYTFQEESYDTLINEYNNNFLSRFIDFEDYIAYVSQSW